MKKGFIVIEYCEDWEQVLCLKTSEELPEKGILTWPNEGFDRHIFTSRKDARDAINRTHHYAKAFGYSDMPEKTHCKIEPVKIPEDIKSE